jgi:hypothetical protein
MALIVEDAIDLHCHFGPDTLGTTKGAFDEGAAAPIDAAQEARSCGHCAMVLKSHSFPSPQVASTVDKAVEGIRVFGGICTDHFTGGLNVDAVGAALAMGAKIVWLPTVHSRESFNHRNGRYAGNAIDVIDDTGKPNTSVRAIAALVKEYGAILATGHTTAEEHFRIVHEFASDIPVLLTHAADPIAGPQLTAQQCRDLADLGATVELTALSCDRVFGSPGKDPREMAQLIDFVGHTRCTLGSDYGWGAEFNHPAIGLKQFFERLWDVGVEEQAIVRMAARNPADLLCI